MESSHGPARGTKRSGCLDRCPGGDRRYHYYRLAPCAPRRTRDRHPRRSGCPRPLAAPYWDTVRRIPALATRSILARRLSLAAPLLMAAATSAHAIDVPQTREEFVKAVADGAKMTTVETFTVDQSFGRIYGLLEEKSSSCLDVLVKRSGFVGNQMHVTSSDYNPTLRKVGRGRAQFALQVVHRPRGIGHKPPAGGLFVMAADITAVGKNKTRIDLYRPKMGFGKIRKALHKWAAGEDARCPKIK